MTAEKIKILVVDDEERFLDTLSRRLSLRDFEVAPATSGAEALKLADVKRFDLALVDLKMPGMGGEQVLEELKRRDPLIEVVILTGHGSIDSAVECTQAGSYGYLQKPCETEELLEVLRAAYQRRVQNKLELSEETMRAVLDPALSESPLAIMRKLKELERSRNKPPGS